AALLRLRLAQADARDLRNAVGRGRYLVVVDRLDVLAREALHHAEALRSGHVRELRMGAAVDRDHVADGVDAGLIGGHGLVHAYVAAVELDLRGLQAEAI